MIPKQTQEAILDAARIEEVVSDFVQLKRRGVNMIGLCPFHTEKTPSFTVSPSKNLYKCFGCGKGGDPVSFLMELERYTFPEALRYLAKKYGIEVEEEQWSAEEWEERTRVDSLYVITDHARSFFQEQLFETDTGKSIGLQYFKQRGFSEEIIRRFGLGYAPNQSDAYLSRAKKDGFTQESLRSLGLCTDQGRDFFRDRVMFTIFNLTGKPIAFAGRIMAKDVKAPKYINSPETEIYHKSKVLYGMNFAQRAMRQHDECFLVEGYTDVISLHQGGIENVVASSGTSLTVEQIRLIRRMTPNLTVIYDGDNAGQNAALRGSDLALEQDLNVRVVVLPQDEDPDSYLRQVGSTRFLEYIQAHSEDFILFKTRKLLEATGKDPVKKAAGVKDLVESIARLPDSLKRQLYLKRCAEMLDLPEEVLIGQLNQELRQWLQKKVQDTQKTEPEPESEKPQVAPTRKREHIQEWDMARVLILYGGEWYDEADQRTVAGFMLEQAEVLLEVFESPLYRKVVEICADRLRDRDPISREYFVAHPDLEVSSLARELSMPEYEYSPGWEERGLPLNQKPPELNYVLDSQRVVEELLLEKQQDLRQRNLQRLADPNVSEEQKFIYLRVQQKLNERIRELAVSRGRVIPRK